MREAGIEAVEVMSASIEQSFPHILRVSSRIFMKRGSFPTSKFLVSLIEPFRDIQGFGFFEPVSAAVY